MSAEMRIRAIVLKFNLLCCVLVVTWWMFALAVQAQIGRAHV